MFDYDKVVKKLGKFDELTEKKQRKYLRAVFCDKEFREWFYGVGDAQGDQPKTNQMVQKVITTLIRPKQLKSLIQFIKDSDREEFDHTACALGFLVAEQALESNREANESVASEYKSGAMSNREAKDYKEKSGKYGSLIGDLVDALKEKASSAVKDIARKSNLPKALVYTTYFIVPDRYYIPKFKISMYTNQLLKEIYKWTGANGLDDIDMIHWGNLFGPYFGIDMTTSAAVAILLEGVNRINDYKECEHFTDVRSVWNSLTVFALAELDNAPENVRRQMLEIYLKRIGNISRNNHGQVPRLRVNLLSLPAEFSNLAQTVMRYEERISSITKDGIKPVADFKSKYVDRQMERLRERPHERDNRSDDLDDPMRNSDDERENYHDRRDSRDRSRPDRRVLDELDDDDASRKRHLDINDQWPVDLSTKQKASDDEEDDSLIKGIPDTKLRKLETMFDEISEEDDDDDESDTKVNKIPLPPDDEDD